MLTPLDFTAELEPITQSLQVLIDKYQLKEGFSIKIHDGKLRTFIDVDELYSSALFERYLSTVPK